MPTIKEAQIAAGHQLDISHVTHMWLVFLRHRGDIRIVGWDSEGFERDLRLPAATIAEEVRRHLQAEIDDLTERISRLGIEPDKVSLASLPEPD